MSWQLDDRNPLLPSISDGGPGTGSDHFPIGCWGCDQEIGVLNNNPISFQRVSSRWMATDHGPMDSFPYHRGGFTIRSNGISMVERSPRCPQYVQAKSKEPSLSQRHPLSCAGKSNRHFRLPVSIF